MQRLIDKDALLKMLKNDQSLLLYDVTTNKYNIEGAIESMPESEAIDFKDYREMRRMYETWHDIAKGYEKVIHDLCHALGKDED